MIVTIFLNLFLDESYNLPFSLQKKNEYYYILIVYNV